MSRALPIQDEEMELVPGVRTIDATRSQLEELGHGEAASLFEKQLELLKKRLLADPTSLRSMFVADGMQAIAWEFQQDELGAAFTRALWNLLLRDDDDEHHAAALHLGHAAQVQAQVHPRDRRAPRRPLSDVQGLVRRAGPATRTSRPTSARPRSGRTISSSSTRATLAT